MRIIDKISSYLKANGPSTLANIYNALPEHTPPAIRGNLNRAIAQGDTDIQRVSKGVYALLEVVRVDETEDGQAAVSYTATYIGEGNVAACFHQNYICESGSVEPGIYQNETDFPSFHEMMDHCESLRGMLVNGDVRDVLTKLKDESFDLLVTDPPYRTISGGNKGKNSPKGMLSKNDGKIFAHNNISFDEWLPEVYRLLKPHAQAYIFTNLLNLRELWDSALAAGFKVHNLLVWEKNTANPSRWYMKNAEYVLYLYKPGKGQPPSIKDCGCKMVHQFNNIVGDKAHETEKPVNLLKMYIENSCPENGWVLEPFAGSNSTMTASFLAKAKCFACEIDERYIFPAIERINGVLRTEADPLGHYG